MRTRTRLLAASALATVAALAPAQTPPAAPVIAPPSLPSAQPNLPTIPSIPILVPTVQAPVEQKKADPPKVDDKKPAADKPAEKKAADKPADKKAADKPVENPMLPPAPLPDAVGQMPAPAAPASPAAPAACQPQQPTAPPAYKVPPHHGPCEVGWLDATSTLYFYKPHSLPFSIANGFAPGRRNAVLLGADNVNVQEVNGIALDGGVWINNDHTFGVGVGGFLMEQKARIESVAGTAANGLTITRPYIDANTAVDSRRLPLVPGSAPDVRPNATLLVAAPGSATGSLATVVSSRLSGLEANLRRNVANCDWYTADIFYGFRYLDLDESLTVFQRSTATAAGVYFLDGNPLPAGTTVGLTDRVRTRNQFYGGEIGGRFEGRSGIFFAALTPKVGFGPIHQTIDIRGRTDYSTGATRSGGLLAAGVARQQGVDGNIGRYTDNRFAILTEIGGQVGVQLTPMVRMALGYNLLYLNHVARPAQQLTPVVNQRVIPVNSAFGTLSGPTAPQLTNDREQFHAHGLSLTVSLQY